MNCQETHDLLHTYVDGELDVVRDVAIAERHATRPVCAATSGARLLEHPSATRQQTRLPWAVHTRAQRGAAAPCRAHRSMGWGGAARRVRGRDTRRRMGEERTRQGWSGRSGREKAAGESWGALPGGTRPIRGTPAGPERDVSLRIASAPAILHPAHSAARQTVWRGRGHCEVGLSASVPAPTHHVSDEAGHHQTTRRPVSGCATRSVHRLASWG